eukprot:1268925-Rhodomonas_salina.3
MSNKGDALFASNSFLAIEDFFDPNMIEACRKLKEDAKKAVKVFKGEWKVYVIECLYKQRQANCRAIIYTDNNLLEDMTRAILSCLWLIILSLRPVGIPLDPTSPRLPLSP